MNEAYKLQAEEEETLAVISLLPYMKDSNREAYFKNLATCKRDIIDIGKVNNDYSNLESLKKEL